MRQAGPLTPAERRDYELGRRCFERGDAETSLPHLTRLIQTRNFADVHYMIGVMYHRKGDISAAAHSLREALRLNPSYSEALLALANVYESQGDFDRSREIAERAGTRGALGGRRARRDHSRQARQPPGRARGCLPRSGRTARGHRGLPQGARPLPELPRHPKNADPTFHTIDTALSVRTGQDGAVKLNPSQMRRLSEIAAAHGDFVYWRVVDTKPSGDRTSQVWRLQIAD